MPVVSVVPMMPMVPMMPLMPVAPIVPVVPVVSGSALLGMVSAVHLLVRLRMDQDRNPYQDRPDNECGNDSSTHDRHSYLLVLELPSDMGCACGSKKLRTQ